MKRATARRRTEPRPAPRPRVVVVHAAKDDPAVAAAALEVIRRLMELGRKR